MRLNHKFIIHMGIFLIDVGVSIFWLPYFLTFPRVAIVNSPRVGSLNSLLHSLIFLGLSLDELSILKIGKCFTFQKN